MIDQPNKILLELKQIEDNLTYNKCYDYLKKYFISKDSYFEKSNIINEGKVETLGNLCEIESDLHINIWDEDLEGLETIDDLTLLVLHELLYEKYNNKKNCKKNE